MDPVGVPNNRADCAIGMVMISPLAAVADGVDVPSVVSEPSDDVVWSKTSSNHTPMSTEIQAHLLSGRLPGNSSRKTRRSVASSGSRFVSTYSRSAALMSV